MSQITVDAGGNNAPVKLRTFVAPPRGFDPLTASAADLQKHGFPHKLDPARRKVFEQVWSRIKDKFQYVEPTFEIAPEGPSAEPHRTHHTTSADKPAVGTSSTDNAYWSGAVVNPPANQAMKWVSGTWTVPHVLAPPLTSKPRECAISVALDGYQGSTDFCQAGVQLVASHKEALCYSFCRWYAGAAVRVTSFPVKIDDTVAVAVCTDGPGARVAQVFFANLTSGLGTTFVIDAPAGVSLSGTSAEWVVERPVPVPNGTAKLPLLADYSQLRFSECWAGAYLTDGTFGTLIGGGTQTRLDMVEENSAGDVLLSHGVLITDSVVDCQYVASGTGEF